MTANESALIDALADRTSSRDEVSRLVARTTDDWSQYDRWAALARDGDLPAWRRLTAATILLSHFVDYPCSLATFIGDLGGGLGVDPGDVVDASILQNVPLDRGTDEQLRTANLPIATSVGPAAVYFTLDSTAELVTRWAIHPPPEACPADE